MVVKSLTGNNLQYAFIKTETILCLKKNPHREANVDHQVLVVGRLGANLTGKA